MKKAWESLNLQLFQNGSVHELCRFKALITLEDVNTSVVGKKKKNLNKQNFDYKLSLYANEPCDERVGLFLAMI